MSLEVPRETINHYRRIVPPRTLQTKYVLLPGRENVLAKRFSEHTCLVAPLLPCERPRGETQKAYRCAPSA